MPRELDLAAAAGRLVVAPVPESMVDRLLGLVGLREFLRLPPERARAAF